VTLPPAEGIGRQRGGRVRVYLAATPAVLAEAVRTGALPASLPAHAVTPSLREWYTEGDTEELELAALLDAGLSSLRVLAAEAGPGAPRRVVLAADVPDGAVRPAPPAPDDDVRSAVHLTAPVALPQVVSAHVDEAEAEDDVRAAMAALAEADAGDEDAQFLVDGADGHDLLWYDATELADLAAELAEGPGRA
jgi:hypothetical protein